MKRDLDLARNILLAVENNENAVGASFVIIEIPNRSQKEISYHVELLHEAGLIEAKDFSRGSRHYEWYPERLTWLGHEFLDSARDEDLWNRAKNKLTKETKNFSLGMLKTVLTELAKKGLGL